jgi:hypothetical protein
MLAWIKTIGLGTGASHLPTVASGPGGAANSAVAARLALITRVQVPTPLQSVLQPVKLCPLTGVAVSVTVVALG